MTGADLIEMEKSDTCCGFGGAFSVKYPEISTALAEKLDIPFTHDPPTLTRAARKALRGKFLKADMGISGCNMAYAETGHITVISNEGNIRMSTTLPKVHVAFMGMERVVANLEDHETLFRLVSSGAVAQKLAGCISYIGGTGFPDMEDGPEAFHLITLDNGRSKMLADPRYREMLYCIRCAALWPNMAGPEHKPLCEQVAQRTAEDYDRLMARLSRETGPHHMVLVSGPSKTGDIELVMVHGTHGPKGLHLIILE